MSAYHDALLIDDTASEQRIATAAQRLQDCAGVVLLPPLLALRAAQTEIVCEVIDPAPSSHRCAEEYKVLIENAARALQRSRLASLLPPRPLRWIVVEQEGSSAVEVWRAD